MLLHMNDAHGCCCYAGKPFFVFALLKILCLVAQHVPYRPYKFPPSQTPHRHLGFNLLIMHVMIEEQRVGQ